MTTTPEVVVFPNALPIVIRYLADYFGDEVTVSATVPQATALHSLVPFIQVVPSGGGWVVRKALDEVVLNINIFHHRDELHAIDDLGRRTRAVIESMQGRFPVTSTKELSGVSRLPDADQLITRVGFTVALLVRPIPT